MTATAKLEELTATLSTIPNMQGLTSDKVKAALTQLDAENERLLAKYRAKTNFTIEDENVRLLRQLESENKACIGCKGYPCKKKSNTGFQYRIVSNLNGGIDLAMARCKWAKVAEKKRVANIPPMYADKTFADYKVDAGNAGAVQGAKSLQSLYIFGNPGTGKTFLASVMGNELLNQGKSVIFVDVPTLLDQMRNTFDRESTASLESLMDRLSKAEVLILDDLGTETPTLWAVERLYLVINARYNAQKPLIVTSNYDLQQAADRLNNPVNGGRGVTGSRIVSRIRGLCKTARISGEDKRRA